MNNQNVKTIVAVVATALLIVAIQLIAEHVRVSWVSPSKPVPIPAPAPAPAPTPKPAFPSSSLPGRPQHHA